MHGSRSKMTLCKTFQRKTDRKKRNSKGLSCTLPSKQSIQDQILYGINFTLQIDEVNEWHSALKELQPHFQAKKHAKKKVLSIPTQHLTPCNYTRHNIP
jgi:hypothetical protein